MDRRQSTIVLIKIRVMQTQVIALRGTVQKLLALTPGSRRIARVLAALENASFDLQVAETEVDDPTDAPVDADAAFGSKAGR